MMTTIIFNNISIFCESTAYTFLDDADHKNSFVCAVFFHIASAILCHAIFLFNTFHFVCISVPPVHICNTRREREKKTGGWIWFSKIYQIKKNGLLMRDRKFSFPSWIISPEINLLQSLCRRSVCLELRNNLMHNIYLRDKTKNKGNKKLMH